MAARRADTDGQALVELAIGMLAVALVLSGLFAFGNCILASLEMRRDARSDAGRGAFGMTGGGYSSATRTASVEVSPMAADSIFGSGSVTLREEVHIPAMAIDSERIMQ